MAIPMLSTPSSATGISHTIPLFPDGKEALIALVEYLADNDSLTHFTDNFKRIIAEGNMIIPNVHCVAFN